MFDRITHCGLAVLAVFLLSGCLTPMSGDEIAALSVCPAGVKLDKVRTNLLEAGFIIKDQGKKDLTTDYHDESMVAGGKIAKRITVLEDDKGLLHYKVWEKKIYFEPVNRIGMGTSFGPGHRMFGGGWMIGMGPEYEYSFEQERIHYQQYRGQYEFEQQMICKGSDKR